MSDEQQTRANADDPSGDGWRDVRPDEILQADDMAQWDHGWSRARVPGIIAGSYPRYRRRIEPQQVSDSEPETVEDLRKRLDAAVRQNVELADSLANEQKKKGAYKAILKRTMERAREAEALVAEAERGGQQVNAELQQLRKQVQTLHNLAEMSRRQVQDEAGKVEQLKQQLDESQRLAQRYRNQLEGAWEHAPKAPRNFRERMVLEKFRAFVDAKDDDPLTFGYVQLRETDPQVLSCSEFVVESWHQDVGGGRLSECVRVFLRHYASEEDQDSRKEISARTYFHVKTVGDYERLLSLLGIGGQTE